MTIAEVGSGQVPIFPTFKGFRKETDREMSGAAKSASGIFGGVFKKAGADSGKSFGSSFAVSAKSSTAVALKTLSADVAKSAREVSASRLKEQDATGKVRVAEAQLAEARRKYAADSSQVVRAEERLATVQRTHISALSAVVSSTDRLTAAKRKLTEASNESARSAEKTGSAFSRLPGIFNSAGASSAAAFGSSFRSGVGQIFAGSVLANVATDAMNRAGQLLGDAASAGLQYGLKGVDLASELEQSTGAIDAVFKDQAAAIIGYANDAATAVGLSRSSYQKYATVVGAQLKNLGLPVDQISGKTNELITLGADLAAQFGGPTADAVGALSSLLRGERDPIERYGVGLKQADIDARKAALGLADLTGEADKQADIQATLALLWEQTADAQGTFFRETDTYAHKTQVLNAQLEESQTRLGDALIPAFSSAATFANDTLVPALEGLIDNVGPKLGDALTKVTPDVEELLNKMVPLVDSFVSASADEGIPGFIGLMDDAADAAPEWIKAFQDADAAVKDLDQGYRDFLEGVRGARADVIEEFSKPWFPEKGQEGFFDSWDDGFIGTFLRDTTEQLTAFNEDTKLWDWETVFNPGEQGALDAGLGAGDNYGLGLTEKQPLVQDAGSQLGAAGGYGAREGSKDMYSAGVDAATGFGDGISAQRGYATAAAETLANDVVGKMRSTLDINSPSRVTRTMGNQTGDGFILGMQDRFAAAESTAAALVAIPSGSSAVSGGTSSGVSPIGARPDGPLIQVDVHGNPGMDEAELAKKVGFVVGAELEAVT